MSVRGCSEYQCTDHGNFHPATCFCPVQDEDVVLVERWRYPERYVRTVLLPRLLSSVGRLEEPDLAARVIRSGDVFRSLDIGHGSDLNPKVNGVDVLSGVRLYNDNDFILIVRLDL